MRSKNLSILHAEMKCLLWSASYIKDQRITSICLETDCSDLSGHDYESNGVVNIRDENRNVSETT